MENNPAFSPLIILGTFALYGLVHSLLASVAAKQRSENVFGKSGKRYYRLSYNVFSTLTLLPVLALPVVLPDLPWYKTPPPWVVLTGIIQIISAVLLALSVIQTGTLSFLGISQAVGGNTEEGLLTGGLYRYIRHPLYTFSMIFLWLTPVMSQNTAALYFAISAYFVIGAIYEERRLVAAFGDDYIEYQKKTPMFVPARWGNSQEG